jgi:hypothetical protein
MKNGKDSESNSPEKKVNRREAIKRMAGVLGGVGGAVLMTQGCGFLRNLYRKDGNYSSYNSASYLDHMYSSQSWNSYYGSYTRWPTTRTFSYYGSYWSSAAYQSRW